MKKEVPTGIKTEYGMYFSADFISKMVIKLGNNAIKKYVNDINNEIKKKVEAGEDINIRDAKADCKMDARNMKRIVKFISEYFPFNAQNIMKEMEKNNG